LVVVFRVASLRSIHRCCAVVASPILVGCCVVVESISSHLGGLIRSDYENVVLFNNRE
jgi:hypothetical protein